ncbi:MAG: 1-acyl-sn-glycerol-3-phosphate acyltransferase [Bacilli bacterium]
MLKKVKYGNPMYYNKITDDFVITKRRIDTKIDQNYSYNYIRPLNRAIARSFYYIIVIPILRIFGFLKGIKVNGRKNVKHIKTGYVIYCNHSNDIDAFLGHVFVARPRETYIIANKDAVCMSRGMRGLIRGLGCLPVPETVKATINLERFIKRLLIDNKKVLMITPEAHIWPYYTGFRPVPVTSFKWVAKYDVPAVPVAVKYRYPKGLFKNRKKPRMTINIGEPIKAPLNLDYREKAQFYHDRVSQYIKLKVSESDNVAFYKYMKKTKKND